MFSKTSRALIAASAAACFLTLLPAQPARAGGFALLVELPPPAAAEAEPDDTLFLVQAAGCYGIGATVSAKAEGLVNGKRVTLPIRLESIGKETYRVVRQWPLEGTWLISLSAKSAKVSPIAKTPIRPVGNVLVELTPEVNVKKMREFTLQREGESRQVFIPQFLDGRLKKADLIDAALRRLASETRRLASSGD